MKKESYPLYFAGVRRQGVAACSTVVAGGFVFCSGASGLTEETGHVSSDDFVEQNAVAWNRIKRVLEEVGSSLENIVKFTAFLKKTGDTDYFLTFEKARLKYFEENCPVLIEDPPAYTCVQVLGFAYPELLVEIDVIAIIPDER